MAGFDDFSEAEGAHDVTESDGRHVLRDVGHPDAHGRVDGEIFHAGEGLAILKGGDERFGELEIGWRDEAGGAGNEFPLADGVGHRSLREKGSGGRGEKQMEGEEIENGKFRKEEKRREEKRRGTVTQSSQREEHRDHREGRKEGR
jgi:hypothetical protein